jgi:hypothetical protein
MNRLTRSLTLLCAGLTAGGCAWTERANRPVWNAFEEHVVPTTSPAFELSLPLTAPGGLAAILIDIGIAHPIQVIDDAADDALDLWDAIDFEDRYYTEAGFLPFRAGLTPICLAGSFAWRSMFDGPDAEEQEAQALAAASARRQRIAESIAMAGRPGVPVELPPIPAGQAGEERLRELWRAAFAECPDEHRPDVVQLLPELGSVPEWDLALADASAVVRHEALTALPRAFVPSIERINALLEDPDEVVRAAAKQRFVDRP